MCFSEHHLLLFIKTKITLDLPSYTTFVLLEIEIKKKGRVKKTASGMILTTIFTGSQPLRRKGMKYMALFFHSGKMAKNVYITLLSMNFIQFVIKQKHHAF
jgi:hypothetical protein